MSEDEAIVLSLSTDGQGYNPEVMETMCRQATVGLVDAQSRLVKLAVELEGTEET